MDEQASTPTPPEAELQGGDSQRYAGLVRRELTTPPANGGPTSGGGSSPLKIPSRKQWTPELRMQLIKEIVTAVLAFLIIILTLIIAWRSFNLVGNATKVTQAKDLLTILLGLAGVVVGYYFGRISADARASQANAKADEVLSQNANLKAKAYNISTSLNHVIDGSTAAMASDSQAADGHLAQLRSLRDELHDLTGPIIS